MAGYAGAYFRALGREIRAFWSGKNHAGPDGACSVGAIRNDGAGYKRNGGAAFADTVFVGGGTPSSVDAAYITDVLRLIPYAPNASERHIPEWECTVEANPGSLDGVKLAAYAEAGVNRLSVGLQSTHERHLKMLGRAHSYVDFLKNINAARNAGFENINVDLLFGLPDQTFGEWERTLESVVSLGIRHLSCYSLSLEEGTPLREAVEKGELPAPDEDLDRTMYGFAVSYLRSAGIVQYELSNFAEPGRECRHNLKYWTGERYIGFGAGAHSYDGAYRFSNAASIAGYIDRRAAEDSAYIGEAEKEKEFIILRLRLTGGFGGNEFREAFGRDFFDTYKTVLTCLLSEGLIEIHTGRHPDGARIRLTPLGMNLANRVFMRFI